MSGPAMRIAAERHLYGEAHERARLATMDLIAALLKREERLVLCAAATAVLIGVAVFWGSSLCMLAALGLGFSNAAQARRINVLEAELHDAQLAARALR